MGKRLYKFKRGLGKEQIGIACLACHKCGRSGLTLFAVDDGSGKRVYACERCRGFYGKHDKGDGYHSEKRYRKTQEWILREMSKKGGENEKERY